MNDISSKISDLLNSPEGLDKISQAAQSILGDDGEKKAEGALNGIDLNNLSLPEGIFENIGNIQNIMRIAGLLNNKKEDSRVNLLLALKPHLSEERGQRIDKAVSMLKIASLLPILKEEGLLNSLGGIL